MINPSSQIIFDPPAPEVVQGPPSLDPYSDPQPYVRFDPDGQIRHSGIQGVGFTWDEQRANPYIMVGDGGHDRETNEFRYWVDHDGEMFTIQLRPTLEVAPNKLDLEPYEEARIEDLPEGRVRFTGPVVGEVDHPGGLFEIGWTTPGDYTVIIKSWPHMPLTLQFTVA